MSQIERIGLQESYNQLQKEFTELKKKYYAALDEVSALTEKLENLQAFKQSNLVSPISMVLKNELTFEKKVLSLGINGKIRDCPRDLDSIKVKFTGDDLQGDSDDFLRQFGPLIMEEVRSKIEKRLIEIEKTDPEPNVGHISSIRDAEGKPRVKRDRTQQMNYGFINIACATKEKKFPTLSHGFNKELLFVILPSHSATAKKLNVILAIGSRERASKESADQEENKHAEVEYTIKMLTHDYSLLFEHARNVLRNKDQDADLSDPLQRISWHHITGLIPDSRMYEATRPNAPFHFAEQLLLQKQVKWFNPQSRRSFEGLNETQAYVVQSLAFTTECGLFNLIGPPGTGKTTTIVALLLERMRQFPGEKILLTAPSNKAIQVVLHKLVEKNCADYAIAVIGTNKDIPLQHEALYAAEFTSPMVKSLRALRKSNGNVKERKKELQGIVEMTIERIAHLTDTAGPGLRVSPEIRLAVNEALQGLLENDISDIRDKDSLNEHISQYIDRLLSAAECIESFILEKAQVVFSTLVASGRKSFHKIVKTFDTVVVDEASQALMPATFIPFKFNPARYLLVGDPQQLPATVQADHLKPLGYADSLMLVMQREMGDQSCAMMLTTQYRMHPAICKVISDLFYEGKLVTDDSVLSRQCLLKKHLPAHMLLHAAPSAFIDLDSVEYRIDGGSTSNDDEARLVVHVVQYLFKHGIKPHQIGIVSGYAAQVTLLKELLQEENTRKSRTDFAQLAVSTVDGFQGDEKDFMLFSCVRTGTSVGFLKDPRRINVAMSRGRHANWVFGQARTLRESNSTVKEFLSWLDGENNCTSVRTREIRAEKLLESMVGPRVPAASSASPKLWGAPSPAPQRGPPARAFTVSVARDESTQVFVAAPLTSLPVPSVLSTSSLSSFASVTASMPASADAQVEQCDVSKSGKKNRKVSLLAPSLLNAMRRK